ncbi:hypothetical protein CDAR_45171 [Caerostris darwini]|uniref:Uncharacterized protein n=1 Tax=Caerostris darwini TaxID=1538125 RepID=A0AAV4QAP3_9ARAC|nr:hypothetical protein CDAR_45171 [Caerostris darwini]
MPPPVGLKRESKMSCEIFKSGQPRFLQVREDFAGKRIYPSGSLGTVISCNVALHDWFMCITLGACLLRSLDSVRSTNSSFVETHGKDCTIPRYSVYWI